MSPNASVAAAFRIRTAWCQQCWPEIGSGWTGNVRFWWTPTSVHQIRSVSGSALSNGPPPFVRDMSQPSPSWPRATVAITVRWPWSPSFQRPMWWLQATTPGRMPSVTQALTTK